MPTLDFRGQPLEVNERGFLVHPEEWNEDVALFLLQETEGVAALTKEHWAVIRVLRDFYAEHGLAPMIRILCRQSKVPLKAMYELFPSGPALGACKVAGLPRPDGCV